VDGGVGQIGAFAYGASLVKLRCGMDVRWRGEAIGEIILGGYAMVAMELTEHQRWWFSSERRKTTTHGLIGCSGGFIGKGEVILMIESDLGLGFIARKWSVRHFQRTATAASAIDGRAWMVARSVASDELGRCKGDS
jgi:hypothetical protein